VAPGNSNTLSLYSRALELRRVHRLGDGTIAWLDEYGENAVAFGVTTDRYRNFRVVMNFGETPIRLESAQLVVFSEEPWALRPLRELPPNTSVWMADHDHPAQPA
jgi:alpha-glucosidase